ncbi:MAG: homoserine kinase [Rhodoferax sp.]|uniref:homoserine kinase n=1 Tax=Rhodoferax sp. TaxID=50421 RepID=UPI003267A080
MAVYTNVSLKEAKALVRQLDLGDVTALRGIQGGIENTNYFATTDSGEFVLTLFERLGFEQLPYYLHLMKHLAQRGIPVPEPIAIKDGNKAGTILHTVNKKPASVVTKLSGKSELAPGVLHCAAVGDMLARMHLAGRDFEMAQPNLRGLAWWNETAPVVMPHLEPGQAQLLHSELAYQNHIAASSAYAALPQGAIHADLFRDNVMFDSADGVPRLSGFFDFYFAGTDAWLFDIAVCLNDWCVDLPTGAHDAARCDAFLTAYQAVRPLAAAERQLLPALLRAGALRFWISRLWDFHLPREAALLQAHDPSHFERVLRQRVAHPVTL